MTRKQIIDKLWHIYQTDEEHHTTKLPYEQFEFYTTKLMDSGNIFVLTVNNDIVAYLEFWFLHMAQMGKIVCGEPVHAAEVNINNGPIAYVANVWVTPQARGTQVVNDLKKEFFNRTWDRARYFVGTPHKRNRAVRVYRKSDLIKVGV